MKKKTTTQHCRWKKRGTLSLPSLLNLIDCWNDWCATRHILFTSLPIQSLPSNQGQFETWSPASDREGAADLIIFSVINCSVCCVKADPWREPRFRKHEGRHTCTNKQTNLLKTEITMVSVSFLLLLLGYCYEKQTVICQWLFIAREGHVILSGPGWQLQGRGRQAGREHTH